MHLHKKGNTVNNKVDEVSIALCKSFGENPETLTPFSKKGTRVYHYYKNSAEDAISVIEKYDPLNIVKDASNKVNNNRTLYDIYNHMTSESLELLEEICKHDSGSTPGVDGIFGEAIDMMACLYDIILKTNPDITTDEISNYLKKKCDKWVEKYGN